MKESRDFFMQLAFALAVFCVYLIVILWRARRLK